MLSFFGLGEIGLGEWVVIFVIALIVFGPNKLPEISRKLGRSLRALQNGWSEVKKEIEKP